MEGRLVICVPNSTKEVTFGAWSNADDDEMHMYTLASTDTVFSLDATIFTLYDHKNDKVYAGVTEYIDRLKQDTVEVSICTDDITVNIAKGENVTGLEITY